MSKKFPGCGMAVRALAAAAAAVLAGMARGEPEPAWKAPEPLEYYGKIARRVGKMLPAYHVRQQALDDETSRRAWTNLVTSYDYNHSVFLKGDLEKFAPMETQIDDAVRAGQVQFAYDVHKLFVKRLEECVGFATNLLVKNEFDFTEEESYRFNREKCEWPATVEEREDIWRRRIKNELLAQTLGRELDAEEEAREKAREAMNPKKKKKAEKAEAEKKEDGKEEKKEPERTPRENLIRRYQHYLKMVHTEQDEESVLQRYLTAVSMAYDPHSAYMSPMTKEDFDQEMNLALFGVGAILSQSMEDGSLEIKEVMKGGPMAREGSIKAGNKIVGVGQGNGPVEDITWKPMRKSIRKIRGPKDTKVVLEVTDKSGASRRRVALIRDEIKLEDQAATGRTERVVLNGVTNLMGYVKLPGFYGTMDRKPGQPGYRSCSWDVAKLVAKFNSENTDGMVLDFRGNGGGSLREAVFLTALFVRPGADEPCPVVQIREKQNLSVLPIFPDQPCFAYRKPMIVLIDRHSASASEIVAGALQDMGRAIVVGDTQSHGKGTVQTVMPVGGEKYGSIKITTARFYRINGSSTQVKGVTSDIRLPSPFDARTDIGEDNLPNALPWTRIEPARHEKVWDLQKWAPALEEASKARRAGCADWKRRMQLVELGREASERTVVPLNREARLKMMRADRAALDESDEAMTEADDYEAEEEEAAEEGKDEKRKDLVLDETMKILADLCRLTGGAEAPAAPKRTRQTPAWLRALGGN